MTLVALVVDRPGGDRPGAAGAPVRGAGAGPHPASSAQVEVGRLLIIMFIPQIFCYGVVGTATAVMNSRQRFALAAGAPAVENLGTIAVLLATALIYGSGTSVASVPTGELLLLGLGSTGAVVLHAATQWWGAQRAGRDAPAAGRLARPGGPGGRPAGRCPPWRQAGLLALQVLTLLVAGEPAGRRDRRLPDRPELLLPGHRGRGDAGRALLASAAGADASRRRHGRLPRHARARACARLLHHHPGRRRLSGAGGPAGQGHLVRQDGARRGVAHGRRHRSRHCRWRSWARPRS